MAKTEFCLTKGSLYIIPSYITNRGFFMPKYDVLYVANKETNDVVIHANNSLMAKKKFLASMDCYSNRFKIVRIKEVK